MSRELMASTLNTESPSLEEKIKPAGKTAQPTWYPKVDNPHKRSSKKKRSKGGKSVAKRGPTALPASRGSGFEEYYADPPMTPQEAQEERDEIYADDLSFEERIQSCIQRFRSRRRLQGNQTHYFSEYLFLGGIDTNPVPFSGHDPKDPKSMTPAEQRGVTATAALGGDENIFYAGDRETWSVDFAGVAAGFFSSMSPITGFEPDATGVAIGVVENFLRYVLHHDVCPEFEGDVRKALLTCKTAREEVPMLLRLEAALPGQFNLAAAKLFGVHDKEDWSFHGYTESDTDPKLSLLTSLALMDEPEMFSRLSQGVHQVIRQFECTVEVDDIQRPDGDVTERFCSLKLAGIGETTPNLNSIGKVEFKPAIIEDDWEHPHTAPRGRMTLYFDDNILENMKHGMKMTLDICELDTGLKFVKTLHAVVPTYHTFLPQQMMRHFKSPRESERPAPSIHKRDCGDDGGFDGGSLDGTEN